MSDIGNAVIQNYVRLIQSLQNAGADSATQFTNILAQYGFSPNDFYTYVATEQARDLGLYRFLNADETVRFYGFANPQGLLQSSELDTVAQSINSNLGNATNAAKNTFTSVISANTALNALDFILTNGTVKKYTPETQFQESLAFAARISPQVQIASVACRLGKAIDGAVYDLATMVGLHPPEALNPSTWEGIVSNDTVFGQAFNWLLALDSEEKATCYADAESVAYCAQWLNQEGFFDTAGGSEAEYDGSTAQFNYPDIVSFATGKDYGRTYRTNPQVGDYEYTFDGPAEIYTVLYYVNPTTTRSYTVSAQPFTAKTKNKNTGSTQEDAITSWSRTYNNTIFYFRNSASNPQYYDITGIVEANLPSDIDLTQLATIMIDGTVTQHSAIPGVVDNGGVIPDTSTWADTNTTLQSLQLQYPDWFNDQLQVETVQPDGQTKQYTYIPVAPVSDVNELGNIDTQAMPATDVLIDPETATLTQLQTLIEALTQSLLKPQVAVNPELELQLKPQTELPNGSNQNNPEQKDKNPGDTGHGLVPPIVLPTGSASSLWAVYHPTQSQLNAFGAWLWSSDFVEQIKRLFNDPMQAVIGVHKVFAPIPTGGSSTIKCGYLDSGVSSATVSSQYTEVNCGTVDCREYFGNVFDYDPHTKVSIYLPFIGVVPLKVSEVMRASINVTYGVDVITGACLAKVKVTRDGGGGILYSYGGSCVCHYPISSGSYAGIISGIVTSAIGIAGGIMTGNPLSAVGGAMAGLHQAHTDVQRSGGFTGCAGAMGPKKPYLIIDRPQTRLAADFEAYQGKPANSTQFIGDCSGFVRATEVHFSAPGVFDEEAREVESLLKAGVKLD